MTTNEIRRLFTQLIGNTVAFLCTVGAVVMPTEGRSPRRNAWGDAL